MYSPSHLESLLTGILTIMEDQMKLPHRIKAVGISGALAYEENRKTQLLNYISESQSLINKINKNWTEEMTLNRCLYDRTLKAVLDRKTDCNATDRVIRNLRPLQEKISAEELKFGVESLEKIMDLLKTIVGVTCWVLHIREDELSACERSHSAYHFHGSMERM